MSREQRVPPSTLLAVLLEASTSSEWATRLGYGATVVDAAQRCAPLLEHRPLSSAHARYLSWLLLERGRLVEATDEFVTLPVRLIDRATSKAINDALKFSVEDALAFEIRAVREGISMGEWVARVVASHATAGTNYAV